VTLNANALKPDFVRSPAVAQKPCSTSTSSNQIDVISLMGKTNPTQLILTKSVGKTITPAIASNMVTVPSTVTTTTDDYNFNHPQEQTNDASQPLMIDFNDPSTTNFLLSALASGASSDSNAIVNHLFQKAQTQQQQRSNVSLSPSSCMKRKLPIMSTGLKNCTETTNLLPVSNSTASVRQSVILQTSANNDTYQVSTQQQQLVLTANHVHGDERKQPQQIFFINNKPYVIQQKLTHEPSSQQRLVLTPSIHQLNGTSYSRSIVIVHQVTLYSFEHDVERVYRDCPTSIESNRLYRMRIVRLF
jgi:hypothetical protein